MIERKKKQAIKKCKFTKYVDSHLLDFVRAIHIASVNMPSDTCNLDNRWLRGRFTAHAFIKFFKHNNKRVFKAVENGHYDVVFRDEINISIKSVSAVFERSSKFSNRPYLKSKSIIVKNCLGEGSKNIKNDNWHKMLVLQRQEKKKNIYVSFGILDFETALKKVRKTGDQLTVRLKNSDYDYFYQHDKFFPEYKEDINRCLNSQLHNSLCNLGDILMETYPINMETL